VRGGGHNVAGTAVVDDGIVVDLSAMRGVRVGVDGRTVHVQGGATWGDVDRVTAPLGLATPGGIARRQLPWSAADDLLVLWTDGLVDASNDAGERFGERRLLDIVCAHRTEPVEKILEAVFSAADAFAVRPADDRTFLAFRL